MSIKLQQLRHLLALDEHGSFVQTSVTLHISQPALSRSIQTLEAQVGGPLFLRDGHGVVATDLGRVLINRARQITRLTDALDEDLIGRQALTAQELAVGSGPFPAATVVSRAAARFVSTHPGFKLRIEVRNWDELLPRLKAHELHAFVAESSTLEQVSDLRVEPLSQRPLYFLARPGHPLAGQPLTDVTPVFNYPIAAVARIPPRILEQVLAKLTRYSGSSMNPKTMPALQCTDMAVIKQVVANSDAVMVASLACVAQELERGELLVLGSEPWMQLNYGIVSLRTVASPTKTMAIALFRDYLVEAEQAIADVEDGLAARWAPRLPA